MIITTKQAELFTTWAMNEFGFKIKNINSGDLKWLRRALLMVGVDLDDFSAITMFGSVYVRDLSRLTPGRVVGMIAHESRHVVMARRMGWSKFYARYVASLKWRDKIEGDGYCGTIDFNRWMWPTLSQNWNGMESTLADYQIGPKRRRSTIKALKRWDGKHACNPKKNNMYTYWRLAGCEDA